MYTQNQKQVMGKVFNFRIGGDLLSFKVCHHVDCLPGRQERVIAIEQDKKEKAISLPAFEVWRRM